MSIEFWTDADEAEYSLWREAIQRCTPGPMPTYPGFRDLTGECFGRLAVIGYVGKKRSKSGITDHFWECLCSCGKTKIIRASGLIGGERTSKIGKGTRSCGCITAEGNSRTHGKSGMSEFGIWSKMIDRCSNPKCEAFADYGGRGIAVCERWKRSFDDFLIDVGPRPSMAYSLDRFPDKNGNYEPGNCRWATRKQQARNTRGNRMITINDETKTLVEWTEIGGIPYRNVAARLRRGWEPFDAIFDPVRAGVKKQPRQVTPEERQKMIFERSRKRTTNHYLTIDGETKILNDWSKISGIDYPTIIYRLRQGIDPKAAVFTPVGQARKPGQMKPRTSITIDGVTNSMIGWIRSSSPKGVVRSTVYMRLKRGWTVKDAIFTPLSTKSSAPS